MSHKVVTLVCSRIVGSAAQKAVLVNMADKASDGGEGVFASKSTIAAETEMGLTTVKRAINDLLEKGLIVEAGHRTCTNGHTVVYDLVISAIAALPEWKPARQSSRTPSRADPVQSGPRPERTVTPSRADPHPVQSGPLTILEPSLNSGGGGYARESDLTWREQMLEAMGIGPNGIAGPSRFVGTAADMATALQWETDLHLDRGTILTVLRETIAGKRDGPPKSFRYFTPSMQRTAATLQAPPLEIPDQTNGGPSHERPIARDRRQQDAEDRLRRVLHAAARID